MHPVLFKIGDITVYSYGVMIAIGAICGVVYMAVQGKKESGMTFDQANNLFLLIFIAAFVGGKVFLFFEDPAGYIQDPFRLLTGRGFVFYGSFLFAVPLMFWYFKRNKLHPYKMLDVMAITTCFVHGFGRIGCFLAGCCYGKPTDSGLGVVFSDPACYANPKNVPLFPTQIAEALFIFTVMGCLFYLRSRRRFYGQLFLIYLMCYAVGRSILELFRGDEVRGYLLDGIFSHAQFIALLIFMAALLLYFKWSRQHVIEIKKRA